MRRYVVTLMVCGLMAGAATVSAQSREWTDRGYANINLGFQGSPGDIEAARTFTIYQESGLVGVNSEVDGGPFFDLSAGARVWKNMSVGLGWHRVSSNSDATVAGRVPHPLFFDRPREFSTAVSGLERSESALHLSFGYMVPLNDKIDVHIFGGPSFFWLSQDVVADVQIGEAGAPFTSVVVSPVVTEREEKPVGGHIGADFTYRFYETGRMKLGAGAFLRYAGASADLVVVDQTVSSDVGGFQFGFGLRTRF